MKVRRLDFEGCFNFRDIGGWRTHDGRTVRWGRLYRADSVHLMTPADAARARDDLGVRVVLDLRSDLEVEVGGFGPLVEVGVQRHHFPLSSRPRQAVVVDGAVAAASSDRSPDTLVTNYLGILEASAMLIVDALSVVAREGALPGVFFCAAGKDRTGVLSAAVLGALGVRNDDIVEDYVLTEESIAPIIERFASTPGSPAMYRELPPEHFAPLPETMKRVLDGVRQAYGSFGDYLLAKGMSSSALNGLRAALLGP